MRADTIVRARIPADLKDKAVSALARMGLSPSDLIRLTFLRVAEEGCLPFAVKIPNRATQKAMKVLGAGKGTKFDNADALFRDLEI